MSGVQEINENMSGAGQIVNVTIGLILIAYVGVEGIKALASNTSGLGGTVGTLVNTVLPILGVVAFIYLVVPRGK